MVRWSLQTDNHPLFRDDAVAMILLLFESKSERIYSLYFWPVFRGIYSYEKCMVLSCDESPVQGLERRITAAFSAFWGTSVYYVQYEVSELLDNMPQMYRQLIDNMRSHEIKYISVERIIYQGQNRRNPATQSYRACKMAASCSWDRSIWWIRCFFV